MVIEWNSHLGQTYQDKQGFSLILLYQISPRTGKLLLALTTDAKNLHEVI